jgi:TetR/AcrR family transcriptional repressor of mexJK operon
MSDEQLDELCPLCPKPAGRPKASEAEARMLELVEAAARLFMAKGYSKVSLEMIAREARVAVRTIYVKFGGKAGLFKAILLRGREHYFSSMEHLASSQRPIREVLVDFGHRFDKLLTSQAVVNLHRMVIAEAHSSPELAHAFFDGGPKQTRAMLTEYFERPDVKAMLREDLSAPQLAVHLINCLTGDPLKRYLFGVEEVMQEQDRPSIDIAVDLFLRGVLR